jgi:hypothetical protein
MKIKIYTTLALILGFASTMIAQAPGFVPAVDDVTAPLPGLAIFVAIAIAIGLRKTLKSK